MSDSPKTYRELADEVWRDAKGNVFSGGLSLRNLNAADGVAVHCLLTARLIQEVESVKAGLTEQGEYARVAGLISDAA